MWNVNKAELWWWRRFNTSKDLILQSVNPYLATILVASIAFRLFFTSFSSKKTWILVVSAISWHTNKRPCYGCLQTPVTLLDVTMVVFPVFMKYNKINKIKFIEIMKKKIHLFKIIIINLPTMEKIKSKSWIVNK